MIESFRIDFDDAGAQDGLDTLLKEAQNAARPAAQAGAQVLYDEVTLNVSRIPKVTGNLAASIYQVYSKTKSSKERATYHVSWNAQKAPHGHLVEYGHIQTRKAFIGSDGKWHTSKVLLAQPRHVAAKPFLRPAWDTKSHEALQAAKDRWLEEMRKHIEGAAP